MREIKQSELQTIVTFSHQKMKNFVKMDLPYVSMSMYGIIVHKCEFYDGKNYFASVFLISL